MKLGDLFSSVTAFFGIRECARCKVRKNALNTVSLKGKSALEVFLDAKLAWDWPEYVIANHTHKQPPPRPSAATMRANRPIFQGHVYADGHPVAVPPVNMYRKRPGKVSNGG